MQIILIGKILRSRAKLYDAIISANLTGVLDIFKAMIHFQ